MKIDKNTITELLEKEGIMDVFISIIAVIAALLVGYRVHVLIVFILLIWI